MASDVGLSYEKRGPIGKDPPHLGAVGSGAPPIVSVPRKRNADQVTLPG
jgi:hypothetical protein